MKVLIIGGGGREHAIAWKLSQSSKVSKIYCAPGNAGIAELAECVPIAATDIEALADFAATNQIDLTFVGPEDPLLLGIVNLFEKRGLSVFGPKKEAAIIEGSKSFAKDLMKKYQIPTAAYETFTDYESALSYLHQVGAPIVIKADGLAAGKGVIVAMSMEEAEQALHDMMQDEVFGSAGATVVIEEFLQGEEMTLLSFVDGKNVKQMETSQDHKAVFNGNQGPNTGGMGTYSPVSHIPQPLVEDIMKDIVKPAVAAMAAEGRPFSGILYTGLMLTEKGPKVIEFNARFGDPETQVILPRLKTDLMDIFLACVSGGLDQLQLEWSEQAAVCVIMASAGYPGPYEKGEVITGLETQSENTVVFHSGTAKENGQVVTNGGRVLGVTAIGDTIEMARSGAYAAVNQIHFDGAHYRTDIAASAQK
jgi:phosphoribosylamine---glycine ligase